MYDVLKQRLKEDTYTLEDAVERITYLTANGKITPSQAEELRALATSRASHPSAVEADVAELRTRVAGLEQGTQTLATQSTISLLAITELYESMMGGK